MSRRTEPGTIVTLRRAEPGESTYLAHTSYRAFHSSTVEGWEGWFREHTGVQRGDTVVAEVEGRRAGNATALALTMALAGRDIPMWGVAAVRRIRGGKWDLVISTHGPYACHAIAYWLRRTERAGRWVADFRDLWVGNHIYPGLPPFTIA